MPARSWRWLRALTLLALSCASPACTLCKPIACAITGPFVVLGEGVPLGHGGGCGSGDGYAALVVLGTISGVCAIGGLVTGVISDINYVTGKCGPNPAANWYHPFETNAR